MSSLDGRFEENSDCPQTCSTPTSHLSFSFYNDNDNGNDNDDNTLFIDRSLGKEPKFHNFGESPPSWDLPFEALNNRPHNVILSEDNLRSSQHPIFYKISQDYGGASPQRSLRNVAHASKRPFTCPIDQCGKEYWSEFIQLDIHFLSINDLMFSRKGDLKYHIERSHPGHEEMAAGISKPKSTKEGKDFPCPESHCKCGFIHYRDLRRHLKHKHLDIYKHRRPTKSLFIPPPLPAMQQTTPNVPQTAIKYVFVPWEMS